MTSTFRAFEKYISYVHHVIYKYINSDLVKIQEVWQQSKHRTRILAP